MWSENNLTGVGHFPRTIIHMGCDSANARTKSDCH